jgi:hypothetical protein
MTRILFRENAAIPSNLRHPCRSEVETVTFRRLFLRGARLRVHLGSATIEPAVLLGIHFSLSEFYVKQA